jgi:hypothetical protein
MRIRSVLIHSLQAIAEGALISLLVVGLIAGTALAAKPTAGTGGHGGHKGGGTASGSISVVMVTDQNNDGLPNYGDRITYDVSKVGVAYPFITTTCVQDGVTVMTTFAGYYPEYMWQGARVINLWSDVWTAGPATCTAVVSNTSIPLVVNVRG